MFQCFKGCCCTAQSLKHFCLFVRWINTQVWNVETKKQLKLSQTLVFIIEKEAIFFASYPLMYNFNITIV